MVSPLVSAGCCASTSYAPEPGLHWQGRPARWAAPQQRAAAAACGLPPPPLAAVAATGSLRAAAATTARRAASRLAAAAAAAAAGTSAGPLLPPRPGLQGAAGASSSRGAAQRCRAFGGDFLRGPRDPRLPKIPQGPPAGDAATNSVDDAGGNGEAEKAASVWSDWQAGSTSQDWESWEGINVADLDDVSEVAELREQVIERRRMRGGRRRNVRDEYMRPIVDAQGIVNRLAVDEAEVEERVFVEAITNQYESREAIKYLGMLVAVPLAIGFVVSRGVANPVWSYAETLDPAAFAPTDHQKVEGAHELHVEELRLRMEAAVGLAPPLTDEIVHEHLHRSAVSLDQQFREANKAALLNVVSDMTSASVFFIMLSQQVPQRQILFRTVGRVFTGLSDTAKAFLIILITDILLGYHSEEGWTATLRLFSGHYGLEAEDELLHIFVATVPVFFDSLFKVWIFIGLNKEDPAAAVTLKQMDRH